MIPFRFLWLAIFAVLVGTASFLAEELFFPHRVFPSGTLEAQIHEDFRKLQEQSLLPQEIKSLHEVYILDDRPQKVPINWTQLSQYDFPKGPEGNFDLQIELFDSEESTKKAQTNDPIVIQYSLFDKATKNKIWELSRQYLYP